FIELALQLGDIGVLPRDLRWTAYREFGFMDLWWERWWAGDRAPVQVSWTPLTYAFLHGGMTHLLLNSAAFLGLGLVVLRIFGAPLFVLFFVVTALGGSVTYGLLAQADLPMVGASGVVFGLIGVLKYAEFAFITRRPERGSLRPFLGSIGALVAINVILGVFMGGTLAWETHLGGFLAGWLAAWAVIPRS
ncbi:MAG: rhomboid family intramembrane serine protease, partial [Pseudomonadota bacterium]